jgi:hypothetical protein
MLEIRPAQLKDLAAIEALFRAQDGDSGSGGRRRQFASRKLWFLLQHTFASILPIAAGADQLFVAEEPGSRRLAGFIQAETIAAGRPAWQVLNLSLREDLDQFQAGTALLDHLCNEGLQRGVSRFLVRVGVGDEIAKLFRARGFRACVTEHALLAETIRPQPALELAGWRPMRKEDQLGLYLLYQAVTPADVCDLHGTTFKEWKQSFQQGWWTGSDGRVRQRQFVVEQVQLAGWVGITPGGGGRPAVLGLMGLREPKSLLPAVIHHGLGYLAEHHPGPVWCTLRHYDQVAIQLLQQEGFEVIASQTVMVKDLAIKVPARARVRAREKRLVPQYG